MGMDKYFGSCIITFVAQYGPVAHLVERLICTEEVAGSSPVRSTIGNLLRLSRSFCNMVEGLIAQLVRARH